MTTQTTAIETSLFGEGQVGEFGNVTIRVVVLPKKKKDAEQPASDPHELLDLGEDELLPETGSTPMSSYLESGKGGKQCCVFLVNGQRQDALDNSFVIQQLGFKYLRNRMMIIVDVDGLRPETLCRLTQGSRQGFYRGDVWDEITKRIVATLRDDPDLIRLEEEAEEQVSELKAGDEKVKHTLDQLIDSHHEHGLHFSEGTGAQGSDYSENNLGIRTVIKDGVVSLLPPADGTHADYPVLVSQPSSSSIRLRPDQEREFSIKSIPSNAWLALSELTIEDDQGVPELRVAQERLSSHIKLRLHFRQPADFDTDQYPIRATLRATARFNGIKEPRRLDLKVLIKPDRPPPEPELFDPPTWVRVSSRVPVKIKAGGADTHVRLRWDGKDELASGPDPQWSFHASLIDPNVPQPTMNFSEPRGGRLSLLVSPRAEWAVGDKFTFEVLASSTDGNTLSTTFTSEVVEAPEPEEKEPRLIESDVSCGSNRRPPYVLKYIDRDQYETGTCWGSTDWTDEDPGCFQEPTDRLPLTLIINADMGAIREYRRFLTKKFTESEVQRRINKYTSHIAFHLYQMYQSASQQEGSTDGDHADQRQRAEILRVASTLVKLMEVSR